MRVVVLLWLILISAGVWAEPLGHSHNDYLQEDPFYGAARAGMVSVEVDVYPYEGRLLVGHSRARLEGDRDLVGLYLEPLQEWSGQPMELVVDIKGDTDHSLRLLMTLLQEFANDKLAAVIVTGARPRVWPVPLLRIHPLVSIEGTVGEMRSGRLPQGCRYVSAKWSSLFSWAGEDYMPMEQRKKLKDLVEEVHSRGLKLRLWGAPEGSESWDVQYKAGVDRINSDTPVDLGDWLEEQVGEETGT